MDSISLKDNVNNYATTIIPEKTTAKNKTADINNETTIISREITETCSVVQNPNVNSTEFLEIYDRAGDAECSIPQDRFDIVEEVRMESSRENIRNVIHSKGSVISPSVLNNEETVDDMDDSINDPDYIPSSETEMVCTMLYFIEYCNRIFLCDKMYFQKDK